MHVQGTSVLNYIAKKMVWVERRVSLDQNGNHETIQYIPWSMIIDEGNIADVDDEGEEKSMTGAKRLGWA
jgi:hypothetical protein